VAVMRSIDGTDAGNPFSYVAHPSATGDVVVQSRVTIHEYVDARAMLCGDMTCEAVEMLFTVGEAGKSLGQGNAAKVFGVPIGTG